jgi:hypothetical protein
MLRRAIALTLVILECVVAAFLVTCEPYNYRNTKDTNSQEEYGRVFASESDNAANQTTNKTPQNPPCWYTAFKRPEWALVIVGIATFLVIGWQAWETRRAVEVSQKSALATERSVKLQEAISRQWVNIENWSANAPNYFTGKTEAKLQVFFDVINPTKMPLTLDRIVVQINGTPFTIFHRNALAPDKKYTAFFEIALNPTESKHYGNGRLPVIFDGMVSFTDAFGNLRGQPFTKFCTCGPSVQRWEW